MSLVPGFLAPRRALVWITPAVLILMAAAYACLWLFAPLDPDRLAAFWPFTAVGLAGALIANSSGVGGGAVFVPAFSMVRETGLLALAPQSVIGLSFAIQCFGMSMGSLTWLNRIFREPRVDHAVAQALIWPICAMVLIFALPSLLIVQRVFPGDPSQVFFAFKLFSITLGLLLLAQLAFRGHGAERSALRAADHAALAVIGLAGGAATAWFSVGVGEFLALYLFLRRFPLEVCVAPAVVCTAVSVLAGLPYHLQIGDIVWEILVYAAPAVMLGGFLARRLAHWLGAIRLKLAVAVWVTGSSAALLAM